MRNKQSEAETQTGSNNVSEVCGELHSLLIILCQSLTTRHSRYTKRKNNDMHNFIVIYQSGVVTAVKMWVSAFVSCGPIKVFGKNCSWHFSIFLTLKRLSVDYFSHFSDE